MVAQTLRRIRGGGVRDAPRECLAQHPRRALAVYERARALGPEEPVRRRIEFFASQFEFLEVAAAQFEYKTKDTARLAGAKTAIVNGAPVRQRAVQDYGFEEAHIANLVVKYDFDWASLKSSTTYFKREGGTVADLSAFSVFVLPASTASPSI